MTLSISETFFGWWLDMHWISRWVGVDQIALRLDQKKWSVFKTDKRSYVWAQWAVARWFHKQMNPMLIYVCCIRHTLKFLNTDFVGSINTRNICLILSTINSFISVSVCIDRGLSALLWPGPILLIKRPYCLCMLVALIDIFVIKLFSYDLKDHTFILQTPASTTPFRLYNGWYHPRTSTS